MSLSISVITPSYNQGQFIERTIQSVLCQGIPGLEYMVCDGGSKDETVSILRRYQDRLRWLSEPDRGQAHAVNKGIEATSGDIIGWLNSDDIYYPGALQTVLDFFEKYPDVEVVYGDGNHIGINDEVIEPYYTEDWDYERLKDVCYLCQPAVFFRRRVVEQFGNLDESLYFCLDYEYWLRLGATRPFVRLDKLLAGSRMYEDNKTMAGRVAFHREIVHMMQKRLGRTPDRWMFNYAHARIDAKGYQRETAPGRVRYISLLVLLSTFYFLRWEHRLPASARRTMLEWIREPLFNSLKEIWRR